MTPRRVAAACPPASGDDNNATALEFGVRPADVLGMNTMACRAVAQAALSAGTASADDEMEWPLLLVAGWLTTAADLMLEARYLRP